MRVHAGGKPFRVSRLPEFRQLRLNPGSRVALAAGLAAVVGAALFFFASQERAAGASGEFPVLVQGPDGVLFNATVQVDDADPLRVLLAAADAGHFTVDVVEYSGYGDCGSYVESISGHEASGNAGWVYEILRPDGWWRPPTSSGCQPLDDGQAVRWLWSETE
jgi:hypothetical protein